MLVVMMAAWTRPTASSAATGTLEGWEVLYPGQQITQSCHYRLAMSANGDLATYSGETRIWSSGTAGRGAYAEMTSYGLLLVRNWYNEIVWQGGILTRCSRYDFFCTGSSLRQEDDGNLWIFFNGNRLWSTGVVGPRLWGDCAVYPETKTHQSWNFDRLGGDYLHYPLIGEHQREQDCGANCAQDSRCKSWTYVPPRVKGPTGFCFLKNTVPPLTRVNGMVSGVVLGR
jgi:hypothetical protein